MGLQYPCSEKAFLLFAVQHRDSKLDVGRHKEPNSTECNSLDIPGYIFFSLSTLAILIPSLTRDIPFSRYWLVDQAATCLLLFLPKTREGGIQPQQGESGEGRIKPQQEDLNGRRQFVLHKYHSQQHTKSTTSRISLPSQSMQGL